MADNAQYACLSLEQHQWTSKLAEMIRVGEANTPHEPQARIPLPMPKFQQSLASSIEHRMSSIERQMLRWQAGTTNAL